MTSGRRYPAGVEIAPEGAAHVRVWAPHHERVELVVEPPIGKTHALSADGDGYFSATIRKLPVGSRYWFRLDADAKLYPDPASRFQPDGPHGPSAIVDPAQFRWSDAGWKGLALKGLIVYELHVGTFTAAGTWAAAAAELAELAEAGINCVELMPVADFPGRFGWGYDGVNLYAPTRLYGTPDDFRRFVNRAHQVGIGVILDVVYNHVGPDGNYLKAFSPNYFSTKYKTEWGEAINFDGPESGPVRDFFAGNAAYWIDEFHLDGLRLDATQNIYDDAPEPAKHILAEIGRRSRAAAAERSIVIVSENEPQLPLLVRPLDRGGIGLDALWNDDFHHSAMVALTAHREAYYSDYRGTAQEFISAAKYGYLYQGQWYAWQGQRRGQPGLNLPPAAFVNFIQNHDQIANSGRGERVHQLTSPGRCRAMTALLLLLPGTPMLFQGQEFAASAPFLYFADHGPELAKLVQAGRAEFLAQFPSLADPQMRSLLAPPHELATFERCKLDFRERATHAGQYRLTKDLLKLRREDAAFRAQRPRGVDGAVLSEAAFVLRFFTEDGNDRILLVNLGRDLALTSCAEPLLAPPEKTRWELAFSTEDPKYGGGGKSPVQTEANGWRIPGEAAIVLTPQRNENASNPMLPHPLREHLGRIVY